MRTQWNTTDFEFMSWHDVHVHGFAALPDTFEFALDLDFILSWEQPPAGGTYFTFQMAPATLVFHGVSEVRIEVDTGSGLLELEEVRREQSAPTPSGLPDHLWVLETYQGTISIRAVGFSQFLRSAPVRTQMRRFSLGERGGISFRRSLEFPPTTGAQEEQ